ncbi:mpv17-like protein 2 isoform X2 [Condylostylus longicornis]|uniref:mpv17-like protein 2 isoform X2 n=1 Tax=Condylostylus longicornis TaxID=2530218 RepID=UPI00244E4577|nr:mpv17-like protein 2 isoform X2 [Condylostylus longicornis]
MLFVRQALRAFTKSHIVHRVQKIKNTAFSEKYLLFTNLGISLTLSSLGDVLEQKYEKYSGRINKWDQKRTMNMAVSGVSVGFICHYWYRFLDKRLPGSSIVIVLKKVVLDQLICSPLYISIFFITLGILEKSTLEETLNEIKEKAWKLYAAEWMVWPVAQVDMMFLLLI